MSKPRFSHKTLLFVVTLAAVLLGWWADHRELALQNCELADQNAEWEMEIRDLHLQVDGDRRIQETLERLLSEGWTLTPPNP